MHGGSEVGLEMLAVADIHLTRLGPHQISSYLPFKEMWILFHRELKALEFLGWVGVGRVKGGLRE